MKNDGSTVDADFLDIPLKDHGLPAKLLEYTRLLELQVKAQKDEIEHLHKSKDDSAWRIVDEQREKISSLFEARNNALDSEARVQEENSKLKDELKVQSEHLAELQAEYADLEGELKENRQVITKLRAQADALSARATVPLGMLANLSKKISPADAPSAPLEQLLLVMEYIDDLNARVRDLQILNEELEARIDEVVESSNCMAHAAGIDIAIEKMTMAIEENNAAAAAVHEPLQEHSQSRAGVSEISAGTASPERCESYIKEMPIEEKYKRAQQRVRLLEVRVERKDQQLKRALQKAEELEKKIAVKQRKLLETKSRAEALENSLKLKAKDAIESDKMWQESIFKMKLQMQAAGMKTNNAYY